MNRRQLESYLTALDRELRKPTVLVVYGSAAVMLLGEAQRTSLDIDIAGPYSNADYAEFSRAAETVGIPVNPEPDFDGDHFEWVSPLLLALPKPQAAEAVILWQGTRLTIKTVSPAQLVASKLIRYDETDQSDVRFLCTQARLTHDRIAAAAAQLPARFREDPLVRENLENLRTDLAAWSSIP